jgi:hypothetical protein
MRSRTRIAIGFIAIACPVLAACGNDAAVGTRDKGNAKLILNMPDGFPNVALKCLGTTGVYVSNNTSVGTGSPAIVLNDSQCGGR